MCVCVCVCTVWCVPPCSAAGPIEDYELPEVVAERARALQLQQQMESEEPPLLPPQNDNRK